MLPNPPTEPVGPENRQGQGNGNEKRIGGEVLDLVADVEEDPPAAPEPGASLLDLGRERLRQRRAVVDEIEGGVSDEQQHRCDEVTQGWERPTAQHVHTAEDRDQQDALAPREHEEGRRDPQGEEAAPLVEQQAHHAQPEEERRFHTVDRIEVTRHRDERGPERGEQPVRFVRLVENEQAPGQSDRRYRRQHDHWRANRPRQAAHDERHVGVERRRQCVETLADVVDEAVPRQAVPDVSEVDQRIVELVAAIDVRKVRDHGGDHRQDEEPRVE
jgi:hypothetical protein